MYTSEKCKLSYTNVRIYKYTLHFYIVFMRFWWNSFLAIWIYGVCCRWRFVERQKLFCHFLDCDEVPYRSFCILLSSAAVWKWNESNDDEWKRKTTPPWCDNKRYPTWNNFFFSCSLDGAQQKTSWVLSSLVFTFRCHCFPCCRAIIFLFHNSCVTIIILLWFFVVVV